MGRGLGPVDMDEFAFFNIFQTGNDAIFFERTVETGCCDPV